MQGAVRQGGLIICEKPVARQGAGQYTPGRPGAGWRGETVREEVSDGDKENANR